MGLLEVFINGFQLFNNVTKNFMLDVAVFLVQPINFLLKWSPNRL